MDDNEVKRQSQAQVDKMVEHLVSQGRVSRSDAIMMVDLARHAVGEAIDVLGSVSRRMPGKPELGGATYLMALRMIHANVGAVLEELIPGFKS